jgi:hypothetical protein
MTFSQWLLESTIRVTPDMFLFAQEALGMLEDAYRNRKPLPMYKVFHARDVDFGNHGRKYVQVRTAPAMDRTPAKADGNLITLYVSHTTGLCFADKNTLAHELIHVIDPGLNIKAGKRRADRSLASLNTRLRDLSNQPPEELDPNMTFWQALFGKLPEPKEDPMTHIIGGYANQDHEFNAYTGADAYSFVDDLYKTANDPQARAAVQKRLADIKKAKHGEIDSVGTHYRDDRKRWKKFARAHYDAYDDYYGNKGSSSARPTY